MRLFVLFAALTVTPAAFAQTLPPAGFLCCNMRSDESGWISDANYQEAGKRVIPVGTPLKPVKYGRMRLEVQAPDRKLWLGNDYSREISLEEFGHRYVVKGDPKARIATFTPRIQKAIQQARVATGMTKEQVLMAVGYPITSENPTLDAPIWRYWLSSFAPFTVHWDDAGRLVQSIDTDSQTAAMVVAK